MDPDRRNRLKELFQSFIEIEPKERSAFLDEACKDDPVLRTDFQALLASDRPAGVPPETRIGTTVGRYHLEETIATGGMGVIYKAMDTKLKRTVALKFLAPQVLEDEDGKTRFLYEAQAAAALDHPNICTVYEIDEKEGQAFIAMAHIEGQSLKQRIDSGPLKPEEALDIAIQATEGIQAAHEKGIVHRDIKPANLMVTDKGQVKIVDFGLAKLSGEVGITQTGIALGTVAYMSPEQARGEGVDQRTDIWSMGVVLYEMLTGRLPFKGENVQSMMFSILQEDPPTMAEICPGLPEGLEQTIVKALAKDPDERYGLIKDMLVDLRLLRQDPESRISAVLPSKAKPLPSIAVLPFRDMSAQKDQEYFCEGMAEEIINALTKLEQLRVVARTSSFSFKGKEQDIREIGRKLNVQAVLEGSVRRAGNRFRITAQLINVADGYHLWSEQYDRNMEDIFAIYDEVTLAIVDELKVKLLAGEKTKLIKPRKDNPEAYQLYLKGRYFLNKETKEGHQKALAFFQQAIEKDPAYALPYSGIADCYFLMGQHRLLHTHEAFQKAKAAAESALELDDNLAEPHTSLANIMWAYDWDFDGAEKEYKQAILLNPSYALAHQWYSLYLSIKGRHGDAISEARKARELDPLSPVISHTLGAAFFGAGQSDRAVEEVRKALEIDPNFIPAYHLMGWIHSKNEKYDDAIATFKKASALTAAYHPYPVARGYLGFALGLAGRSEDAEKILDELHRNSKETYIPPFQFALLHMGLGRIDQAFEWLEKAFEEHDIALILIKGLIRCHKVESDPRFGTLLKKMGLDPPSGGGN